jgi:hypothetical protein
MALDLRGELAGCPFIPRCSFARDACAEVDMALAPVGPHASSNGSGSPGGSGSAHLSACPFASSATLSSQPPLAVPDSLAGSA